MHSALCQPTLEATSSPSLYGGRKISPVGLALLWTLVYEDPECTSRELLDKVAQHQAALALSVRVYGAARFKHVEAMAVATAVEAVTTAVTVKAVTVKAVTVKAVTVKAATVKTHTRYKAGVLATSQDNDEGNKE